jgi:hypothetical protein
MDRSVIQTFWGGPISDMEILCLKSWVGHGHPVHLYTYDDISGLPAGVITIDAGVIVPADEMFLYTGPAPVSHRPDAFSYMPFADLFRYRLLRFNGGLWMDLDIILLQPIPDALFEKDFFCSSERTIQAGQLKAKSPFKANIGVIYCSEPESDLMIELVNDRRPTRWPWNGLKKFTKWVERLGLAKGVLQPSVFCDMNWWDLRAITVTVDDTDILPAKLGHAGTPVRWPAEAVGVHLWRGLLRQKGMAYGKAAVNPRSYLGRLYSHAEQVYLQRLALL